MDVVRHIYICVNLFNIPWGPSILPYNLKNKLTIFIFQIWWTFKKDKTNQGTHSVKSKQVKSSVWFGVAMHVRYAWFCPNSRDKLTTCQLVLVTKKWLCRIWVTVVVVFSIWLCVWAHACACLCFCISTLEPSVSNDVRHTFEWGTQQSFVEVL